MVNNDMNEKKPVTLKLNQKDVLIILEALAYLGRNGHPARIVESKIYKSLGVKTRI